MYKRIEYYWLFEELEKIVKNNKKKNELNG